MLHAAGRVDPKLLVLAACACARESLQFARTGDARPRAAIEAAEVWAHHGDGADITAAALRAADAAEEAHEAGYHNAAYAAQAARDAANAAVSGRRGGGFTGPSAAQCANAVAEAFVMLHGVDAARSAGGLDAVARYADAVRREWRLKLADVVRRNIPTVAVLGAATA